MKIEDFRNMKGVNLMMSEKYLQYEKENIELSLESLDTCMPYITEVILSKDRNQVILVEPNFEDSSYEIYSLDPEDAESMEDCITLYPEIEEFLNKEVLDEYVPVLLLTPDINETRAIFKTGENIDLMVAFMMLEKRNLVEDNKLMGFEAGM